MYSFREIRAILACVLALAALVGWYVEPGTGSPLIIKRMATVEELDKGFLVSCAQVGNPYTYKRVTAETRTEAVSEAAWCFDRLAGLSEDRKRRP